MILGKNWLKKYKRPEEFQSLSQIKEEYGNVEEWYATYIRYIGSLWGCDDDYVHRSNEETINQAKHGYKNDIERAMVNFSYYYGTQDIQSYKFMMKDVRQNALPYPFHKGDDVYDVIEHRRGSFSTILNIAQHTVRSLEHSVKSERSKQISRASLKRMIPKFFNDLKGMGYEYMPERGQQIDPKTMERASRDAGDQLEQFGMDLTNDFISKNDLKQQFSEAWLHQDLNRRFGIWVRPHNGRLTAELCSSWSIIRDPNMRGSDGKGMQFVGLARYRSLSEIASYYHLKENEYHLLKKLTSGSKGNADWFNGLNYHQSFQPRTHLDWFRYDEDDHHIAEVVGYWKYTDKKGKRKMFGGVLLGGCVLVDYGEETNIVYQKNDPDEPILPIIFCQPNLFGGRSKCVGDRIIKPQEDIDAAETQRNKTIVRAKGKGHIFKGSHMGEKDTTKSIAANLDQLNMHVSGFRPIQQTGVLNSSKMVEEIDQSLDTNIMLSLGGFLKEKRELQKLRGSTSSAAMGQQRVYMSRNTQETTIGQNNLGSKSELDYVVQAYVETISYALNKYKLLALDPDYEFEIDGILDKYGKNFMHLIKRFQLEDLGVEVTIEDVIDEKRKEQLVQELLPFAQNAKETGFTHNMWVEIRMARTWSELLDIVDRQFKHIQDERVRQEMRDKMFATGQAKAAEAANLKEIEAKTAGKVIETAAENSMQPAE